jgi:hypothetical protein
LLRDRILPTELAVGRQDQPKFRPGGSLCGRDVNVRVRTIRRSRSSTFMILDGSE